MILASHRESCLSLHQNAAIENALTLHITQTCTLTHMARMPVIDCQRAANDKPPSQNIVWLHVYETDTYMHTNTDIRALKHVHIMAASLPHFPS